jgi:ABC-type sugar transport system ATPase subunit
VLSTSGSKAIIELRGNIKVQAPDKKAKKGERVVLAIRPETLIVEKGMKKSSNSILGTLERVTFEGSNIRYEIRLENDDLIVLVKPSMIGEWFNVGEKVAINFPPERIHLFEYPLAGLKEEIAVE